MSDAEVLTPRTPPARTLSELRSTYIERARRNDAVRAGHAHAPFGASAQVLGTEWGVGVGLHFELIKWLRWLALLLMLCAIPFLIVIGCSIFTDSVHMYDHNYGVKKYGTTKLHSMTFAAIVDDSLDNGTLQYMNTEIGKTWKGPMAKSTFLIWISLVDAGAMLVFVIGLAALWYHLRRFAKQTDKNTLEAADYTVLVRGLPPDADAVQVGEHFGRFGEIMDVVLVTDRLSSTLQHCGRAARLQQRRAMVLDEANVRRTDGHTEMMEKLDQQLADIAEEIRDVAEKDQSVKAAFITFNSENERRACTAQCPNSWLGSLLQPRAERFQRHKAFWVRPASAPEDYKFENLAASELQLAAREFAINLIMLLLVLVCAAAITKLTDISNQQSASVKWFGDKLTADSITAMLLYGGNTTAASATATAAAAAANGSTLQAQLAAYCSVDLPGYCTAQIQSDLAGDIVRLQYGQSLIWANATSRLLYERAVREELECSVEAPRSDPQCPLQGCLPCVCLGVQASGVALDERGGSGAGTDLQQLCSRYINQLDIRTWGIRLSISAVVAVLNSAIKWVLQLLVLHGSHWTHTARERSFALQCFVAMLINTVVVLLLTNCDSLGRLAREDDAGSWVRFFVRYGSYSDFTAGWYENVGLSIFILMLINVTSPVLNLIVDELWQATQRCAVLHCLAWPLQADYDMAWARPRFTLAQRTADLLLNASLALLFGTGMPLLYLVFAAYLGVAELADRWALTRLCSGVARYHDALTKLVMGLLPWMAVAHCAFGLWMHTYFRVVVPEDGGGDDVAQLGAAAVRATNAGLSSTSKNLSELQSSGVWQRITQPNGLPLLLLCVAMALWLLVGRHIVWQLLSCLGRAAGRLCCPPARRMMRIRLSRDTDLEVHAVPYAEALVEKKLYGTPTYRLAHHPHYVQYFAASGLNRAVGVAALVAAAASGGARRHTFTRLKTVQRRGRLPGGSAGFRILPEPIMDASHLASLAGLSGLSRLSPTTSALVAPVQDAFGSPPGPDDPPPSQRTSRSSRLPASQLSRPKPGDDAPPLLGSRGSGSGGSMAGGLVRGPDVHELLRREEEAAAAAAGSAAAAGYSGIALSELMVVVEEREGEEGEEQEEEDGEAEEVEHASAGQAEGGAETQAERGSAGAAPGADPAAGPAVLENQPPSSTADSLSQFGGSSAATGTLPAATAVCVVVAASRQSTPVSSLPDVAASPRTPPAAAAAAGGVAASATPSGNLDASTGGGATPRLCLMPLHVQPGSSGRGLQPPGPGGAGAGARPDVEGGGGGGGSDSSRTRDVVLTVGDEEGGVGGEKDTEEGEAAGLPGRRVTPRGALGEGPEGRGPQQV